MVDSATRLLCLRCRSITEFEPGQFLACCPECHGTGTPANADDTVTVTLTKHELRILTMWATNWANSIVDQPRCEDSLLVTQGIVDALGTQTDVPLTLSQEMADVRAEFPQATITVQRDGKPTDE